MEERQSVASLCKLKPILIIGCGKNKQFGYIRTKRPAYLMYTGPMFRMSYIVARRITSTDRIYILSAKYGLMPSIKLITPYEKSVATLSTKQKQRWIEFVSKQIERMVKKRALPYFFLCPEFYRKGLKGKNILPKKGIIHTTSNVTCGMYYYNYWLKQILMEIDPENPYNILYKKCKSPTSLATLPIEDY